MLRSFPEDRKNVENSLDQNPAIQLFGRRLFSDQTTIEFLVEFLLITVSHKRIKYQSEFESPLPPLDLIRNWPDEKGLEYAIKARLNLKLFSFFGSSKLITRHKVHHEHLKQLDNLLMEKIYAYDENKKGALKTIENLFLGFHGAGLQRTWCAQSFLPICGGLLANESIWKKSKAKNIEGWIEALKCFDNKQYLFLARGGEVLYLQICNAFSQKKETIDAWLQESGLAECLANDERDPDILYEKLNDALGNLMNDCPKAVSDIANFIDSGADEQTARSTDFSDEQHRYTECGWCPAESWQEGYLFAVEFLRLCESNADLIERLELLEIACTMQVLRSLAKQSARYSKNDMPDSYPEYRIAVSDPEGKNNSVKSLSKESVRKMEKIIYDAIRIPEIKKNITDERKLYNEADKRYAHKLFIGLSKKIGFIIPRRGQGMRFILNEKIMRFLIMALVPNNGRLTYDSFKYRVETHFGIVFDEASLAKASKWINGINIESSGESTDNWVQEMIDAAGFFRRLSDSCSLVDKSL